MDMAAAKTVSGDQEAKRGGKEKRPLVILQQQYRKRPRLQTHRHWISQ